MAKRSDDWFIVGNLTGRVLGQASGLPGKALHVAMAIHHLSGLSKSRKFKLTYRVLDRFNVSRKASARALEHLEAAGLITVQRKRGAYPLVTLVGAWHSKTKPRRYGDDGIPTKRVY